MPIYFFDNIVLNGLPYRPALYLANYRFIQLQCMPIKFNARGTLFPDPWIKQQQQCKHNNNNNNNTVQPQFFRTRYYFPVCGSEYFNNAVNVQLLGYGLFETNQQY